MILWRKYECQIGANSSKKGICHNYEESSVSFIKKTEAMP